MTCLGVLERGERGDDYGTSLKEGGVIEMSTTVLHSRAAPSLCIYLPVVLEEASSTVNPNTGDVVTLSPMGIKNEVL